MKTKGNAGHLTAVIILSVLLVLGIGLCGVLFLGNRTEKLDQSKNSGGDLQEPPMDSGEGNWEEETVTENLDAFLISAGETPAGNQPQAGAAGAGNGAASETTPAGGAAAYLCDYSSQRLLTEADVAAYRAGTYEGLPAGRNVVQMIINEMYARHGYQFVNEEIQAYFNQKEWYQAIQERNTDMDAVLAGMSDIEKANVEFLSGHGEEE